jgi:hypothetical protein
LGHGPKPASQPASPPRPGTASRAADADLDRMRAHGILLPEPPVSDPDQDA